MPSHGGEGPNGKRQTGARRSMSEVGADKMAEMPERPRRVDGGTAEGMGLASQTDTARRENALDGSTMIIVRTLRHEDLVSFRGEYGGLERSSRTAAYGTVPTVVWEMGGGDPSRLPDSVTLAVSIRPQHRQPLAWWRARVARTHEKPADFSSAAAEGEVAPSLH